MSPKPEREKRANLTATTAQTLLQASLITTQRLNALPNHGRNCNCPVCHNLSQNNRQILSGLAALIDPEKPVSR